MLPTGLHQDNFYFPAVAVLLHVPLSRFWESSPTLVGGFQITAGWMFFRFPNDPLDTSLLNFTFPHQFVPPCL